MNVSAVVVRYRGGQEVARCLRSLLEYGGKRLEQVLLVDSGSGDGGAEALADEFSEVRIEALEENRSFAHAANHGAASCTSPLLLLLNPDTEVPEGAVDRLAEYLETNPQAAGAVPLLEGHDGRSQHRWQLRRLPTALQLGFGRPGSPVFPGGPPRVAASIPQPAAAAWLIRREVWEALDGLDPCYAPAWWEDVDFCARLLARQGSVEQGFHLVPTAKLRHIGGSSVSSLSNTDFLIAFNSNLLRYAERHHRNKLGRIRVALRVSLFARALARPSRRRAYADAARQLGSMTTNRSRTAAP